ncbi:MAG: Crp/Fnr family transcriptional regulator [Burkholderiales bacterium]|nr:Crp/Fnr family transcriptional regulator [Burkholderiales bacterium]
MKMHVETPRSATVLEGVIANLPMFRQAPRPGLAELARSARSQHVHRGAAVCRRGDPMTGFYAVAYGMVKLALRTDAGEEKVLRLVGPGETFGEAVMFLEKPCPVDAIALADSLLVMLPAEPVFALLERDPRFARSIIASLSQRMHALVADVEASSLRGGLQRVAAYLDAHAEAGEDGVARVRLPTTKTVIASRLGITKETFSRLLRELAQMGLIAVARREIALLGRDGLAQIARSGPKPR